MPFEKINSNLSNTVRTDTTCGTMLYMKSNYVITVEIES